MGAALPSGRGYAARERERERAGAKNRRYLESERERERAGKRGEREIDRIAITASEWRGCSMESRRRWGFILRIYLPEYHPRPSRMSLCGEGSMLRRGRPARGQGNESRNADFPLSLFRSCLFLFPSPSF